MRPLPFLWYALQVPNQRFLIANQTIARFTFSRDRAAEFSEDGREVVELALDSLEEVKEYTEQFRDALLDVSVIAGGQVISFSDFADQA